MKRIHGLGTQRDYQCKKNKENGLFPTTFWGGVKEPRRSENKVAQTRAASIVARVYRSSKSGTHTSRSSSLGMASRASFQYSSITMPSSVLSTFAKFLAQFAFNRCTITPEVTASANPPVANKNNANPTCAVPLRALPQMAPSKFA